MKEREIAEIKAKAGKRPLSNPHSISISNGRHEAPPPASHPSLMTRGGYTYHHHQQQQRPHEQQHHPHHSHHPQRSTHAYTYEYAGSKRARPDESMSDVDEDVPPRWRAAPRRQGGSATGSGRSVSPSDDEDRDAEGDADDADGDAPESEEGVDDGGKEKRGSSWAGRKRGANGDGEEQGDNQSADADADGDGDAELDADADGDDDVEASMDVVDVDADMDVDVVSAQPHASQSRGSRAHNTRTQSHHAQAGHQHHHRQEHEMRSRREEDSRMRSVMSRGHRSPMIGASRQPMAIAGCLADLDSQYGRYVYQLSLSLSSVLKLNYRFFCFPQESLCCALDRPLVFDDVRFAPRRSFYLCTLGVLEHGDACRQARGFRYWRGREGCCRAEGEREGAFRRGYDQGLSRLLEDVGRRESWT